MGVSRFCARYPAVLATLQRSLLELVCKYQKTVLGYVALTPLWLAHLLSTIGFSARLGALGYHTCTCHHITVDVTGAVSP